MPHAAEPDGILRQNLVDAGHGPEIVRQCMAPAQKRDRDGRIRVLSRHRRAPPGALHQSEKRDCPDDLVDAIQKQQTGMEELTW